MTSLVLLAGRGATAAPSRVTVGVGSLTPIAKVAAISQRISGVGTDVTVIGHVAAESVVATVVP